MTDMAPHELRITFDEALIRRYGGRDAGLHSEKDEALAQGYPEIISWGTLTILPFWDLIEQVSGEIRAGISLKVRLAKPVCAGDEVVYAVRSSSEAADGSTTLEANATTARYGIVAIATAVIK
jgi:hypothetical protein